MRQHFQMFAAYNYWANTAVYDAAARLDDEALNRNTGAFFGSLLGTLNHILVADRIWLKRFTGEGNAPTALDTTLQPTCRDSVSPVMMRICASYPGSNRCRIPRIRAGSPT